MIYEQEVKEPELVIVEEYIEYWQSQGYVMIND